MNKTPTTVQWPKHEASLTLSHNNHKDYYQTIEEWEGEQQSHYGNNNWISEDERELAIKTDSLWVLHWYPNTPIGFYEVWGAGVETVLEASLKMGATDKAD